MTTNCEDAFDERVSQFHNAFFRPQLTFEHQLDVVSDIVNDAVAANLYLAFVSQHPSGFVRYHVETDDDC